MITVALLSNPQSTGNQSSLPRVRSWCAKQTDIFHYEVEAADQIGEAMASIALVNPRVIAVNGGDGTVQAVLTELHSGGHFPAGKEPPVAVLPNGKTNLIALDLGAQGDPLTALERVAAMARLGLEGHIVQRELISLHRQDGVRPVLGMFMGGAGLADVILYCRTRIYPLGLPNSISHAIAAIAAILSILLGLNNRLFPPAARPLTVQVREAGELRGRFSVLIVTTLEKLLFNARTAGTGAGADNVGRMKLLAVGHDWRSLWSLAKSTLHGRLGDAPMQGMHFEQGREFRIEGEGSSVILDGELYTAQAGQPITLTSTRPVPFLQIAA